MYFNYVHATFSCLFKPLKNYYFNFSALLLTNVVIAAVCGCVKLHHWWSHFCLNGNFILHLLEKWSYSTISHIHSGRKSLRKLIMESIVR